MPSKYNPNETSPDVKVSLVDLVSALRILDILPEYVLAVVEIEERKRQQLQTGGQASRQGEHNGNDEGSVPSASGQSGAEFPTRVTPEMKARGRRLAEMLKKYQGRSATFRPD
ncbi:hypothetical protein CVT26_003258 [Gymnopilus dilepis]|uniref:Uncharacterized protein n=1 Tax=Gymnopilus dilepis TaxID=231916 RepID=A0A409Y544_9AGAR|nr:hypothetical protein CVT26_003258 [Gymnopilus dilepis]